MSTHFQQPRRCSTCIEARTVCLAEQACEQREAIERNGRRADRVMLVVVIVVLLAYAFSRN